MGTGGRASLRLTRDEHAETHCYGQTSQAAFATFLHVRSMHSSLHSGTRTHEVCHLIGPRY
jgi:hypothetical protein